MMKRFVYNESIQKEEKKANGERKEGPIFSKRSEKNKKEDVKKQGSLLS